MTDTTAAVTYPYPAPRDMRLGLLVKDVVTGLVGITSSNNELLTGTLQFYVQPQIAEGGSNTVVEGEYFDWQRLDVLGEGVSKRYDPVDESPAGIVKLGEHVRNLVNGFEGYVVMRQVSLNGCLRFTVENRLPADQVGKDAKQLLSSITCDWKELERIDVGVSETVAAAPSGGPSLKHGARTNPQVRFK